MGGPGPVAGRGGGGEDVRLPPTRPGRQRRAKLRRGKRRKRGPQGRGGAGGRKEKRRKGEKVGRGKRRVAEKADGGADRQALSQPSHRRRNSRTGSLLSRVRLRRVRLASGALQHRARAALAKHNSAPPGPTGRLSLQVSARKRTNLPLAATLRAGAPASFPVASKRARSRTARLSTTGCFPNRLASVAKRGCEPRAARRRCARRQRVCPLSFVASTRGPGPRQTREKA